MRQRGADHRSFFIIQFFGPARFGPLARCFGCPIAPANYFSNFLLTLEEAFR
jgi:hypothetical protein